ncbi:NAD-dependent epimerase/dehydratase family protein, partial [bacterium]
MKALVTGGAGFIGSNLVQTLLARGDEVTVLDNLLSGHRINLDGLDARFVEGDIRDADALVRAAEGAEAIFHLAASVGNKRPIDHPVDDASINAMGTVNVLEAARKVGARKVVYSSSAGIFGELKTLPIREDHPIDPDSPYGSSKLMGEKHVLAYSKIYDLEGVALRYFNVYGPRQRFDAYGNVIPIFAFKMMRGEPITIFGDGEQTRDFIHVRDVVQANLKGADVKGVWGAFNMGSGTRITINHLVELLQEASGVRAEVVYGPDPRSLLKQLH